MNLPAEDVSDTGKLPALQELQNHPQWVCWRHERRKGKLTKVPYNPSTGTFAHADKPQTWAGYAQAQAAREKHPQRYDGLGFMFGRDYTGIDLDHCVNPDGRIDAWARGYLDRLKSYAEYSPSKTGIHILVRGTIPSGLRRRVKDAPHSQAAVEMYCERRYFTITGQHVVGTPITIEDCPDVRAIHKALTDPTHERQTVAVVVDQNAVSLLPVSDDALLDKALSAKNGATFRALWQGDTSGYVSQSEAELALCNFLAFWTDKDAGRMDRLFRRSALYRHKWDRPARSGESYGQGTIARAIAHCTETYSSQSTGKVIPFRRGVAAQGYEDAGELPELDRPFVFDCLRDEEEGDGRLYGALFRGRCIYDHTEGMWYEWQGHYWERDECKHALLLASGPLASCYLQISAQLSEEAARAEHQLDPEILKRSPADDAALKHYEWLKQMTCKLIERARALKKLRRAQAVLTYAQAFLRITSREWDTNPWLLGTPEGVIELKSGRLRDGKPEEYIRSIVPTTWRGLNTPAPRFERFLHEVFIDRPEEEREELIAFLQRALGYGITGLVNEHIFLMLYGEEGRNGKDTLMTCLQRVLGSLVGAVSNDVMITTGRFMTPGSAKPHLCALQGKRIAWASETSKGARFDVGEVKFLTGGGDIAARQLYGRDYTFCPSHLLVLLTNNKPHADAQDSAFWDRLCPIIFTIRFVDHPVAPNERLKDRTLGETLELEAGGILAWLVRGCLDWQREGLSIPSSVSRARADYRQEEDTLGQFFKECCVLTEGVKAAGKLLYERYREWTEENQLKAMSGNTFGIELKKRFTAKREEKGWYYSGIGLRDGGLYTPPEGIQPYEPPPEANAITSERDSPVYPVYLSQNFPYEKGKKGQKESSKERYTGYTGSHTNKDDHAASKADGETCIPDQTGIQESGREKMAQAALEATAGGCTRDEPGIQEVYSTACGIPGTCKQRSVTYIPVRTLVLEAGALPPAGLPVETPDGPGRLTGNREEQDVSYVAQERRERLRYKFGVTLHSDGREHFYLPGAIWEVRVVHEREE